MIDLTHYRNFLSEKAFQVITTGLEESKKRNHQYLELEHIFLAYARIEIFFFNSVLAELGLDPANILDFFMNHLDVSQPAIGVKIKIPSTTKTILRRAWEEAQQSCRDLIEPVDLFRAIFQETEGVPVKIFKSLGVEPGRMLRAIESKSKIYTER